ncbi:MAG: hypothetical protein WBC44_18755 [Planctomycetaceae bacterium]
MKRSFGSEPVDEATPKAYKRTLRCEHGHEWDTFELPTGYIHWLLSIVHAGRQLSTDGDRLKPANTWLELHSIVEQIEKVRDRFQYGPIMHSDGENETREHRIDHGERLSRKLDQGWPHS